MSNEIKFSWINIYVVKKLGVYAHFPHSFHSICTFSVNCIGVRIFLWRSICTYVRVICDTSRIKTVNSMEVKKTEYDFYCCCCWPGLHCMALHLLTRTMAGGGYIHDIYMPCQPHLPNPQLVHLFYTPNILTFPDRRKFYVDHCD